MQPDRTDAELMELIRRAMWDSPGNEARIELIRAKGTRKVVRVVDERGPAIIKLWSRKSWKADLGRRLGRSSGRREWLAMLRARSLSIPVPGPVALVSYYGRESRPFAEALVSEDLGVCELCAQYLKGCVDSADEIGAASVRKDLVGITETMVQGNLFDPDHSLMNFVRTPAGRIFRLDLELATRVLVPPLQWIPYGTMLGRLIVTHTFAVQPLVHWSTHLAESLLKRLRPPRAVLSIASKYIEKKLETQDRLTGLSIKVPLPW